MKQSQKKEKLVGKEAFYAYYRSLFGSRWEALEAALCSEPEYCTLCFKEQKPYFLDAASVCAALTLPVKDAQSVLDVCAAPGGKTLVLASNLGQDATLLCNERSRERATRLCKVVKESLPQNIQERTSFLCTDGATLCQRLQETFDCILLDAPCSSERHVLKNPTYLAEWSPARTKHLAASQWALLSSSWRLLSPNGYLLYATCALSPDENDGIVQRLQKKYGNVVQKSTFLEMRAFFLQNSVSCPIKTDVPLAEIFSLCEETALGVQFLPDKSHCGPLYFSLLQKSA